MPRQNTLTPKVAGRYKRLPRPSSLLGILGAILALLIALGAIAFLRWYTS